MSKQLKIPAPGTDAPALQPLAGDPTRQAIDSLLGYDYQIWRTVEAWLRLDRGQTLYIECAEDFDVVTPSGSVATQVKNSPAAVTLNSADVREAVLNFWTLRRRNTGREGISMRFLTRGAMGKEKASQLGAEKGLELWRQAAGGNEAAGRLVADHIRAQTGVPADLADFLRAASAQDLREALFSRIEWAVEEPSIEAVQLAVSRLAINLGSQTNTPPSVSAKAVPALLERCRGAAIRQEPALRSLTLEDAQLCFESSTTLPVPITGPLMAMLGAGASGHALTFAASTFDGELPDLPVDGLPRTAFVGELVAHARNKGCVLIVGSEGEGKSTAGNMLARVLGASSHWMDLSGCDETTARAAVENALVLLRSPHPPAALVLDDLPAAQGVPDAIWARLTILIGAARRSGTALAMTSKGVAVDMIDSRFRSAGVPVAPVPRIGEPELIDYFLQLGCPSEPLAQALARITLAHSGDGHPKLVHLAALELRDRGWQGANASQMLSPPRSVEEARSHARQTACKVVPQPDRDLLFTLSLGIGAFDRSLAIEIGTRLGLDEPGAAFDRLAGRWLDQRGAGAYKATPLLSGQAAQLWPPQRLRQAHAVLLDAHMARDHLRVDQAMELFLQAFQAEDERRLLGVLGTVAVNLDNTPGLAEELELLVAVGPSDDAPAIAFSEHGSMMLRFVQFRIAKVRRPEAMAAIARRWLLEIERARNAEVAALMRSMRGLSVASSPHPSLDPAVLMQAIRDATAFEELAETTTTGSDLGLRDPRFTGRVDSLQLLFLMAQTSVETPAAMTQMLQELDRLDSALRQRLLGAFDFPLAREGFSMFDRVLVGTNRLGASADWGSFASALRHAVEFAKAWGALSFGAAALRTLSIVLSEYMGDSQAAAAVVDELGDAALIPVLTEQKANVAFQRGDDVVALELWEASLLGGQRAHSSGVRDPFAMRKAAIAASRLGNMRRGAEWFEIAAGLMADLPVLPAAAFRIDACYCWIKAADGPRALQAAGLAREELRDPVDPEADPRGFALRKLLGYVVMFFHSELDGQKEAEPAVGMASNPELDIAALVTSAEASLDALDMMLVELAQSLGIVQPWLADAARRWHASTIPVVVMRRRVSTVRDLLRSGRYAEVAPEVYHFNEANIGRATMHRRGIPGLVPLEGEPDDSLREAYSPAALDILLLTLPLARMSRVGIRELIETWRSSLASLAHGDKLMALIDGASSAFLKDDVQEALTVLQSSSDHAARIGAAASVLAHDRRGAGLTAQVQWLLSFTLLRCARQGIRLPLEPFCTLFARQWELLIECPALLVQPRLSQPLLRAAVASAAPPSQKLLLLAEAGQAASAAQLPAAVVDVLRDAVRQEEALAQRMAMFSAGAVSC